MDSLRKVEEELRSLAVEFKKKYPEVVDAAERALSTLKTMREMYVARCLTACLVAFLLALLACLF